MYAGLRAATEHADYRISVHPDGRYVRRRRHQVDRLTSSLAIAEYVAGHLAGWPGLAAAGPPAESTPADAQHRPHRPSVRSAGPRADRAGPRLRRDRLLLRAGHPRRDPRRPGQRHPPRQPRRAAAAHPRERTSADVRLLFSLDWGHGA